MFREGNGERERAWREIRIEGKKNIMWEKERYEYIEFETVREIEEGEYRERGREGEGEREVGKVRERKGEREKGLEMQREGGGMGG